MTSLQTDNNNDSAIVESIIGSKMQAVVDMFNENGMSPNAIVDFNNIDLEYKQCKNLPCGLRFGSYINSNNDVMNGFPVLLPFTHSNATAFLSNGNDEIVHDLFENMAFRIMMSLDADRYKFSFVDNMSFGKKVNIMHRLPDRIKSNAIIDDDKKMANLITELENDVKNFNSNQLAKSGCDRIEEFNKTAGSLTVPYRFVFIYNFSYGFSREMIERFFNLINKQNATKAGIYIFYNIDATAPLPYGFDMSSFLNISTLVDANDNNNFVIDNSIYPEGFFNDKSIKLDSDKTDNIDAIIDAITDKANKIKQTIISFDDYLEDLMINGGYWQGDTRKGIKIPIGKRPVDETVYFEFGGDTSDYFAMVGGRPGYGKTVLLHNIICNGAILYSPQELNFYLIDCTNGTGFKPYAKLPHAKFVSITNQREYTVSALDNLVGEMYRRAEIFKDASEELHDTIEKIEEYRKRTGVVMSRIVVIIDEFQVLLEKEDRVTRKAKGHLEKLIREGRKYGINIIFCTQSYRQLDFNTDLITLRIAFNLKDIDSEKVLGNDSARNLIRKGEAILNNQTGNKTANVHFQGAFTDKMLKYVEFCCDEVKKHPEYQLDRFVFDGKINGDLASNKDFLNIVKSDKLTRVSKIYIGVPSFIRNEHIYFKIRSNSGSNLLVIGNDINSAMSTIMLANYQLVMQNTNESKFYIVDFLSSDDALANYYKDLCSYFENVIYVPKRNVTDLIEDISNELQTRIDNDKEGKSNEERGRIVLSLSYVQASKELKKNGYMLSKSTEKLIKIIKDGPDLGIHIFLYSYNYKGLSEIIDPQLYGEFDNKIIVSEGGGVSVFNDINIKEPNNGYGLLQTEDEIATYNPDPFMFYNEFSSEDKDVHSVVLKEILSIKNTDNSNG